MWKLASRRKLRTALISGGVVVTTSLIIALWFQVVDRTFDQRELSSDSIAEIGNAELQEIMLVSIEVLDAQFQYLLSVSFAVIVAVFVAGDRLTVGIRAWIAAMYLLVSYVFVMRLIASSVHFSTTFNEAIDRGLPAIDAATAIPIPAARVGVVSFGVATTVWFALLGKRGGSSAA